ncbi:MAG: hypothetical protein JSS66_05525 [Armatimonadetes bacterium]|nr:hypothetical protein [Armatimonadota bacterium]
MATTEPRLEPEDKALAAAKRVLVMPRRSEEQMDIKEMYRVSRLLENKHALFYMIWEMGLPVFTRDLPTAAVVFDPETIDRPFGWYFNPDFWESLDDYTRAFILGHESLHILFNHIKRHNLKRRFTINEDGSVWDDHQVANIAQDIVINHALVNYFGFVRDRVKDWKEACWVDTIWPDRTDIPDDECFEYYYDLLKQDPGKCKSQKLMDIHDYFDLPEEVRKEIEKKLNKQLTVEEKKKIKDLIEQHVVGGPDGDASTEQEAHGKQAGTEALGAWIFVEKPKVVKKPKWETIVRNKVRLIMREQYGEVEQWAQRQRNHESLPRDLKLPAEMEDFDMVVNKAKIDLVFFLDASGSCTGFTDRFFKAATSVPDKVFKIHLCSFDTRVYELDIRVPKMQGGGGTAFDIMEDYIQASIKSGKMKRYPDAVFVITDGYGSQVNPQIPDRWFWFMTENYRHCIPAKSHVFMLNEFE